MLHARAATRPLPYARRGANQEQVDVLLCDRGPDRAVGLAHCERLCFTETQTPVLARARGLLLRDGNWARHHAETVRG